jgi:hypothetical protein
MEEKDSIPIDDLGELFINMHNGDEVGVLCFLCPVCFNRWYVEYMAECECSFCPYCDAEIDVDALRLTIEKDEIEPHSMYLKKQSVEIENPLKHQVEYGLDTLIGSMVRICTVDDVSDYELLSVDDKFACVQMEGRPTWIPIVSIQYIYPIDP